MQKVTQICTYVPAMCRPAMGQNNSFLSIGRLLSKPQSFHKKLQAHFFGFFMSKFIFFFPFIGGLGVSFLGMIFIQQKFSLKGY
jgi:hypothetical protein